MSHARASDSRPQYFGGDLLTHRSDAGLRMSEVDYGSARAWAPHTHWRAFFALLVRGGYVEALGRTELPYRPLDLGFHPESTRHTDRIAADDTRFFLLELDESWVRRLSECGREAALAPRMCGGRSHELALRLYREFRAGDVRHSQADVSKSHRLLGYAPAFAIEAGIAAAMPWYVEHLSAPAAAPDKRPGQS